MKRKLTDAELSGPRDSRDADDGDSHSSPPIVVSEDSNSSSTTSSSSSFAPSRSGPLFEFSSSSDSDDFDDSKTIDIIFKCDYEESDENNNNSGALVPSIEKDDACQKEKHRHTWHCLANMFDHFYFSPLKIKQSYSTATCRSVFLKHLMSMRFDDLIEISQLYNVDQFCRNPEVYRQKDKTHLVIYIMCGAFESLVPHVIFNYIDTSNDSTIPLSSKMPIFSWFNVLKNIFDNNKAGIRRMFSDNSLIDVRSRTDNKFIDDEKLAQLFYATMGLRGVYKAPGLLYLKVCQEYIDELIEASP